MTAVALSRFLPRTTRIELIESEEIGTVGVGEATVPYIRLFNSQMGFDEHEFMRRTQATFKLGIEFKDWRALGDSFFHGFGDHGPVTGPSATLQHWLRLRGEGDPTPLDAYSIASVMAQSGRFTPPDPNSPLARYSYAYHFDATLYAQFLRENAESHGVTRTEGRIVDVELRGEDGFIAAVRLGSGERITGDLFIDCSGFAALLIERALKTGYEDFSRWLPVDRAWAAPCVLTGEVTPYTRASADKAGWRWRIPLRSRVGNGYVFSSGFIGEDQARDALEQSLEGERLAEPRLLKFVTGRRKQFWSRNCIAIGLSSGFLEPLESTSISLIQNSIGHFLDLIPDLDFDPRLRDEYNRREALEFDRIRDFIILHYCATQRDDAELWRYCRAMALPDTLVHKIEMFKASGRVPLMEEEQFQQPSWTSIFIGMGLYPDRWDPIIAQFDIPRIARSMLEQRSQISRAVQAMPTHSQYLSHILGAPEPRRGSIGVVGG